MRQLVLEIAPPRAPTLDNFVAGDNAELLAHLRAMAGGASAESMVYLWGDAGCGRSHLLQATILQGHLRLLQRSIHRVIRVRAVPAHQHGDDQQGDGHGKGTPSQIGEFTRLLPGLDHTLLPLHAVKRALRVG